MKIALNLIIKMLDLIDFRGSTFWIRRAFHNGNYVLTDPTIKKEGQRKGGNAER